MAYLAVGSLWLWEAGKRSVAWPRDDMDAIPGPADPTLRPSQGHIKLHEIAPIQPLWSFTTIISLDTNEH